MRRVLASALVVLTLGGCAYYNGMYNTKRLAGSARRAERDGRPFEANNLWGQVINRADSLVTRHPRSKYVDEAMVLKGLALARLNQCPTAVAPLGRSATLRLEPDVAEEATLALGRCKMELGDAGAAALAFGRVAESADPARRREARVLAARALRITGRPDEALRALDGLEDPRVPRERLLALAAAGRGDEALVLADSLIQVNDSARAWDSVLTTAGESNPLFASALVDHLGRRPNTPPAIQARRLVEDAARLEPVDTARATRRLVEAASQGKGNESGDRAWLRLFRHQVARSAGPADLVPLLDTLRRPGAGGTAAGEAQLLAGSIAAVKEAADSAASGVPLGDLRLFLAAESARDTLHAPVLAATLFRQVIETWPESPYAPKAWLAARALDPAWGEQVRPELEQRYAASPYLAFVRGEEPLGYRELEDSLQSYALTLGAAQGQRRTAPPRGRRTLDPDAIQEDRERGGVGQRRAAPRRGLEP
jgi:hypothetical protein